MLIMVSWIESKAVVVKPGQPDIGRPATFRNVTHVSCVTWLHDGTAEDADKAAAYLERDHAGHEGRVHTYACRPFATAKEATAEIRKARGHEA